MTVAISWYLIDFLAITITLLSATYLYFSRRYKYFEDRRIPFEPPKFAFGSLWPLFTLSKSYSLILFDLYNKHKGKKFVGFFQFFKKCVLIIDVEMLKNVLVRDFAYFDGKSIHYNRELEPLTAHMFALEGQEWKVLRGKVAPAFTPGKLKGMFHNIIDVGQKLKEYVSKLTEENDVLECKDVFMRYGLAVIASTGFGLESDVLADTSSAFFRMAETLTASTVDCMIRNGLMFYGGHIAKKFNLRIIPKEVHDFFFNLVKDTVEYRETHGTTRDDVLQLLMQLREGATFGNEGLSLTVEEMAAQSFVFILAGFETSSNAMSFFLYEMALNPDIQERVQAEVDAVEEISYDTLADMEYLDMAIDETLRKHMPLGILARVCSRDYPVPGTDQIIEKGTEVLVSIMGLHFDPELFPEPEKFIPERFSKENKGNIQPISYMPFGEGPRFCIGMRLGKLTVKAGLAILMKEYSVQTTPKTPIPLTYDPLTINTVAKGGMWLRLVSRQKM